MEKIIKNKDILNKRILLLKKQKKTSGITLIALVITIIVLLILAGVSIASLTGENGILTRADTARRETAKQSAKEQVQVEVLGSIGESGKVDIESLNKNLKNVQGLKYKDAELSESNKIESLPAKVEVDEYEIEIKENGEIGIKEKGDGTGGGGGGSEVTPGEIVTGGNKEYTNNGTAVIPEGFAIVPGLEDVSQGLVISDKANDKNDEGNQFVWIPVDKATFETRFKRTVGYKNGNIQTDYQFTNCGEANGTGTNEKLTESNTTKQEAIDMYASVKRNGGFYIGRYEAGKEDDGTVVCKKGVTAYGNIIWGKGMTDESEGAVYESRKFANDKGYTSVVSTLCYGVQWDAALNFIDPNYITEEVNGQPNCQDGSYVKDSTGKGNYDEDANNNKWKGNPTETGKLPEYAEKNIYDMAGNLLEWTMESYSTYIRVFRGGYYLNTGSDSPVSNRRNDCSPTGANSSIGFRPTLYVKD